ncbi:HET-domain-containing protein [Lojkania enalia]|uniref:HET-domain-containing protein n=1 Tax=Lojkania enalia TaxID=147567 RepID=A0A9P4KE52_9PLEO|nr:HET-domain-containing protein [Didymosphaeria enalia]
MEPYEYDPLPASSFQSDFSIRLIILPPGPRTGPISITVFNTKLSQAPDYRALSYCWGDPKEQGIISITSSSGKNRSLKVPASLIPFLYRTRARGESITIWIDSICINQGDEVEKKSQVARMGDIYLRAKLTMAWLGPAADGSDDGLDFAFKLAKRMRNELAAQGIGTLSSEEQEKINVQVKVGHPGLEAYLKILERPYFERSWVVQEVVLSQSPWVVCGDSSIHWLMFFGAAIYLLTEQSWVFEFYSAHRFALLANLRISQKEWEDESDPKWWRLLMRHRECKASDARDKIFAFWGLRCMKSFGEMGIEPNYEGDEKYKSSTERLYMKLAIKGLKRGDSEILRVPRIAIMGKEGEIERLDVPTWVPDWRCTEETPRSLMQAESNNVMWQEPYNASFNATFSVDFNEATTEGMPTKLKLRGVKIGRISHLTPRWILQKPSGRQTLREQAEILRDNQAQIREWEAVLRPRNTAVTYKPTGERLLDVMYRTFTCGAMYSQSDSQIHAAIAGFESRQRILRLLAMAGLHHFLWVYTLVVIVGHIMRYFGVKNPEWAYRAMVPGMVNRKGARLAGADGNTYVGLVPGISEVDDEVFLIAGLNIPLILRRGKNGGWEKENYEWELIGDSYIHGAMTGEIWRKNEGCIQNLWIV